VFVYLITCFFLLLISCYIFICLITSVCLCSIKGNWNGFNFPHQSRCIAGPLCIDPEIKRSKLNITWLSSVLLAFVCRLACLHFSVLYSDPLSRGPWKRGPIDHMACLAYWVIQHWVCVCAFDCGIRSADAILKDYGKNWPSVWVKMVSSWVCICVYILTLLLPKCIPGRDFSYVEGADETVRQNAGYAGILVWCLLLHLMMVVCCMCRVVVTHTNMTDWCIYCIIYILYDKPADISSTRTGKE